MKSSLDIKMCARYGFDTKTFYLETIAMHWTGLIKLKKKLCRLMSARSKPSIGTHRDNTMREVLPFCFVLVFFFGKGLCFLCVYLIVLAWSNILKLKTYTKILPISVKFIPKSAF